MRGRTTRPDPDGHSPDSLAVTESSATASIRRRERFAFGENWRHFLTSLEEARVRSASASLMDMLDVGHMDGLRFLDAGSGSGLFSLAAQRAGAHVVSFDFDPASVSCTESLKDRFAQSERTWKISVGSVLDDLFLDELGSFDVVYSWGVLHHTGDMWRAIDNVAGRVKPGGRLFIAIYNDQGWISRYWLAIKELYVGYPVLRPLMRAFYWPYFVGARYLVRRLRGKHHLERGMSYWHDMVDWLGGLPFEVATPEHVVDALVSRGFVLRKLRTCRGRSGCNEYVFERRNNTTGFHDERATG